jgi:hypothetical protein
MGPAPVTPGFPSKAKFKTFGKTSSPVEVRSTALTAELLKLEAKRI